MNGASRRCSGPAGCPDATELTEVQFGGITAFGLPAEGSAAVGRRGGLSNGRVGDKRQSARQRPRTGKTFLSGGRRTKQPAEHFSPRFCQLW